jgi:hypothetical protein
MTSPEIDIPGSGWKLEASGKRVPETYNSVNFPDSQTEWREPQQRWWHMFTAPTATLGRRWSSALNASRRRHPRTSTGSASRHRPFRTGAEVDAIFRELKEDWKARTGVQIAMSRFMDPAYQRIIGLGLPVLPNLLYELSREPSPQWFWALNAIVGRDQAQGCTTVQDAINAWLEWGKGEGYTG